MSRRSPSCSALSALSFALQSRVSEPRPVCCRRLRNERLLFAGEIVGDEGVAPRLDQFQIAAQRCAERRDRTECSTVAVAEGNARGRWLARNKRLRRPGRCWTYFDVCERLRIARNASGKSTKRVSPSSVPSRQSARRLGNAQRVEACRFAGAQPVVLAGTSDCVCSSQYTSMTDRYRNSQSPCHAKTACCDIAACSAFNGSASTLFGSATVL